MLDAQPTEKIEKPANPVPKDRQDLYDIFVAQGVKLAIPAAKKMEGKTSIDLLGNTLFDIVNKVETQGAKNGVKFGIDVILHGSNEILGHLIKISKVQINEDQVKAAVGLAVGRWVDDAVKTGKLTPEQLQEMVQQGNDEDELLS